MNEITALQAHPLPTPNLTAKSDTPSKTTARPHRFRQDHPRRTPPSPDWTAVKVLTLDEVCDSYIRWMLNRCGGNREATAQFLGIGRTSLYRYLKKLDCKNERVQPGSDFRAN
jgi:DNA-binding NtrC family response regulator